MKVPTGAFVARRNGKVFITGNSGFPKSQNVASELDRRAGVEREVVGYDGTMRDLTRNGLRGDMLIANSTKPNIPRAITVPTTGEAKQWEGYGTALKPAVEYWWLVRKPTNLTYAENVLQWGVGALNIDAARIGRDPKDVPGWHKTGAKGSKGFHETDTFKIRDMSPEEIQERCGSKGRFPSHLILSHDEGCLHVGSKKIAGNRDTMIPASEGVWEERGKRATEGHLVRGFADEDGSETMDAWQCVDGCPVRELDLQSGKSKSPRKVVQGGKAGGGFDVGSSNGTRHTEVPGYADSGGASRFFYQAKPARGEKEQGLLGHISCIRCGDLHSKTHVDPETGNAQPCIRNNHATVKSVALMSYLIKLICPPDGLILDPFMGSGTTGVACMEHGYQFVGIEQDLRSYQIAKRRIEYALEKRKT